MSEQTTPVSTEEGSSEQTQERQYTPIELKAIDQGWIPKEEFDGDESEFIDAPEFVRRGELFSKIEQQSKHIRRVEQALEAMRIHNTKIKEVEYQRALKTLQEARKQAFRDGEHEQALALEERIDEIKAEKEQIVDEAKNQPVVDEEYTAEFQNWVSNNPWYENNRVMRAAADALGKDLYNAGHSPAQVLKLVESEIKKEFSHKFKTPASSRAPAVEAPTRSGTRGDSFKMDAGEREIMNKIVATGIMTEAEYIKQLKATR